MEKNTVLAVRRGAWTKEEDSLLTKCVEKYGEGRWHLVPLRAGLNRCRKSCRLRWLNYLNPNIKRGLFTSDEVDLIVRMHKLLGNRWTWIAGRIPGRTANDIKNFWNTHIQKSSIPAAAASNNIVRPRPRKLQETPTPCSSKRTISQANQQLDGNNSGHVPSDSTGNDEILTNMHAPDRDRMLVIEEEEEEEEEEGCMSWWSKLLEISENETGARVPFTFPEDEDHRPIMLPPGTCNQANIDASGLNDLDLDFDFDFDFDFDVTEFVDLDIH